MRDVILFLRLESNRKGLGKLLSGFPTFAGKSSREGGSPFVGASETSDVRFLPGTNKTDRFLVCFICIWPELNRKGLRKLLECFKFFYC